MASAKAGKCKLFINMVEDATHIANQPFVNDDGVRVIITEEEADTLITWRNRKQVIFKVRDEVFVVPGIKEDRLGLIFSVFDIARPWRTTEEVSAVLATRRLSIAIDAGLHVNPGHWRSLYGFVKAEYATDDTPARQFDQLVIASSASGDIHQVIPSCSSHTPLSHVHILRAVQSNPLLQTLQTIQITDVSIDQLFTVLHFFWDEQRFKSTLVDYKSVVQLGVLLIRMPMLQLMHELALARASLFHYLQEERILDQLLFAESITNEEEES